MKRNILLLLVLAIFFLGLLVVFIKINREEKPIQQNTSTIKQDIPTTQPVHELTRFSLVAQNNSGEEGWVAFKEIDGKAIVKADVLTYPYPADGQPATIYAGSCNNLGAVKYQLEKLFEGASETVLPISKAELASQLPFAINIYKSASENTEPIACVDVTSLE